MSIILFISYVARSRADDLLILLEQQRPTSHLSVATYRWMHTEQVFTEHKEYLAITNILFNYCGIRYKRTFFIIVKSIKPNGLRYMCTSMMRMYARVCVCMCVCISVCLRMYMCICEGDRENVNGWLSLKISTACLYHVTTINHLSNESGSSCIFMRLL